MYNNTERFFPVSDKTPERPLKIVFRDFFLEVLIEFSGFESLTRFDKQKSGLSMGGAKVLSTFSYILFPICWKKPSYNIILTAELQFHINDGYIATALYFFFLSKIKFFQIEMTA